MKVRFAPRSRPSPFINSCNCGEWRFWRAAPQRSVSSANDRNGPDELEFENDLGVGKMIYGIAFRVEICLM